jgi:hypothetical protein
MTGSLRKKMPAPDFGFVRALRTLTAAKPALMNEDDNIAYFAKQTGHSLRQRSIDLPSNYQQRVTRAVVDPVVGAGRHGQMTPRHTSI